MEFADIAYWAAICTAQVVSCWAFYRVGKAEARRECMGMLEELVDQEIERLTARRQAQFEEYRPRAVMKEVQP